MPAPFEKQERRSANGYPIKSPNTYSAPGTSAGAPVGSRQQAAAAMVEAEAADVLPPLSLLNLRFHKEAYEHAFLQHAASAARWQDVYGALASFLQLLPGSVFVLTRGVPGCMQLISISWCVHLAQMGILARAPTFYIKHRLMIVLLVLAVARVLTATRVPYCSAEGSAATRWLYKTGIIPLAWYNIILPLPWRYTVLTQLASVSLYQCKLVVSGCQLLTSEPDTLPGVRSLWPRIKSAVDAGLSLAHGQAPGSTLFRTSDGEEAAAMALCWSSITSIHLFVGLLLPLPVMYLVELRRRARFYRQLLQEQQQQQSLQAEQGGQQPQAPGCSEEALLAAFHVPATAVVLVVAALGATCMLGIIRYGHVLQRLLGI